MADTELIFKRPAITGLPVTLIFNEQDGGGSPSPDVTVALSATITDFPVSIEVGAFVEVTVDAIVTNFACSVVVGYQSNTPRPVVGQVRSLWQDGKALQLASRSTWEQAKPLPVPHVERWKDGVPLHAGLRTTWEDSDRSARPLVRSGWQDAAPLQRAALRSTWQEAVRLPHGVRSRYSEALRLPTAPVREFFGQGVPVHIERQSLYQQAVRAQAGLLSFFQQGIQIQTHRVSRWQEAMRPPAGQWVRPVVPPQPDPCYVPELPVVLVFREPGLDGVLPPLVFFCERHAGPTPGTIVVPVRRTYIVFNSITLHRIDTGAELRTHSFSMSLDDRSWTWSWNASLHADAGPHLGRESNGDPAEFAVVINGIEFRLRLEDVEKDRRFMPQLRWAVSGRGLAAVLGADRAPSMSFGNPAFARTAQQLMADALTINGVPIGWAVDFGLTDWLVPAGAWSFQGTYIDAINDIAGAAGGYVQPHPTDQVLRILPRYPVKSWDWGSVTPDFEIPGELAEVERTKRKDKPAYNGIFVGGTTAGVFGPFRRTGTLGDILAPQVAHSLITHADAHRQRAIAELSDTGRQEDVTISMMVLPETGIITPGKFVRYAGDSPVMGLVRNTAIDGSAWPKLRQQLTLETHV